MSCSYQNGSDQSKISTPQPQTITAGISTGNTTESATLSTQSGWLTTTWSKIIFEKNLSPSIRIVQDENNTTAFFRDQKIASRINVIKDGNFFEYYSIEKEITDALKTNEIEPEKFTAEQKKQFGELYAREYFYIYTQNPYSEATPYTASWVTILTHRVYEWPSDGWIIDENTDDILTFTWEVFGIKQIVHKENWWYILGENAYSEASEYLNLYSDNKNINNFKLKQLSSETNEEYKQFDFIGDKQIKLWYGPRKTEKLQTTKKEEWKSYVISL